MRFGGCRDPQIEAVLDHIPAALASWLSNEHSAPPGFALPKTANPARISLATHSIISIFHVRLCLLPELCRIWEKLGVGKPCHCAIYTEVNGAWRPH